MMAIVANNSYVSDRPKWSAVTSKYENEESKINHALVQFGFNEIEHVVTSASDKDPFDMCGLYLGNHILENEGKKYQIFMASMEGYPQESAWISNLDLGADTQAYYDIDGDHPEWTNKKHHKGFDVTANRAFNELKKYMDKKANEEVVDKVVLVTGHSRGGAITNLVGKLLKDNGIKSLAFGFNGCKTTTEEDEAVLKSYSNIFAVESVNDYICRYPFGFMGFKAYGNVVSYDLVAENAYYRSLFNHDFSGNTKENLDAIDDVAKAWFISRKEMYEYCQIDPEISEFVLAESLEASNDIKNQLSDEISKCKINGFAKCEIVENTDTETMLTSPYMVRYFTKPGVILKLAATFLEAYFMSSEKFNELLNLASDGIRYLSRYIGIYMDVNKVDLTNIFAFACPHLQKTCVAGAYVAK